MKSLIVALFIINCIKGAPISEENDDDLVAAAVIFRHGARTTYGFYPTDPYINETYYPVGLGGLTNEGKLGEYKLGCYLRQLYGSFLGEDYVENRVYVRTTDVTRTKMSAQLVLAGLFPPSKLQEWNHDLKWQPIPFEYKSEMEEDLFHPSKNCPFKLNILETLPNLPEIQEKYIKPFGDLYQFIQEKSGKNMTNPADMQDIFFILKTENDLGFKLPNWTDRIYPEMIEKAASVVYNYYNYNQRVKLINSGFMLKKILDDFQMKINGFTERKIWLYSGHETTVGFMMDALNLLPKDRIPPYGSAISFELRKDDKQHYIKLRYRNDPEAVLPIDLQIAGCDKSCPFHKFRRLLNNLVPKQSVQELCKLD